MVDTARRALAHLLATGHVSPAAYRVLTGLALLVVAHALWTVRSDVDPAAAPVAVVSVVAGVVLAVRGVTGMLAARR